jgi:hypothetical protein
MRLIYRAPLFLFLVGNLVVGCGGQPAAQSSPALSAGDACPTSGALCGVGLLCASDGNGAPALCRDCSTIRALCPIDAPWDDARCACSPPVVACGSAADCAPLSVLCPLCPDGKSEGPCSRNACVDGRCAVVIDECAGAPHACKSNVDCPVLDVLCRNGGPCPQNVCVAGECTVVEK